MYAKNLHKLKAPGCHHIVSPLKGRCLTDSQREECFYCQGCDVEMLDSDESHVSPATKETFCSVECADEYFADR